MWMRIARQLGFFSLVFFTNLAFAVNTADPSATIVSLRTDCGTQENCFDSMQALLSWANTRQPNAMSPLIVDIGPGSFGGFSCAKAGISQNISGYITLRGSGRGNTTLGATEVFGCQQLVFQDLSIVNLNGSGFAVTWWSVGSAKFSNVELTGKEFAWWEFRGFGNPQGQFYWWDSILNATPGSGGATIQLYGNVHRFYGGEINSYAMTAGAYAVSLNNAAGLPSELQMYGSAVRAKANPGTNLTSLTGVRVDLNQTFHLHGGSIGVDATDAASAAVSVTGLQGASNSDDPSLNSVVHVLEAAYALKPKGSGGTTRLTGVPAGMGLQSPFLWPNGPNPPVITSQKGADLFVETDCASAGCQSSGTETHLHIYNNACTTAGPWFDVVTGRCRGL